MLLGVGGEPGGRQRAAVLRHPDVERVAGPRLDRRTGVQGGAHRLVQHDPDPAVAPQHAQRLPGALGQGLLHVVDAGPGQPAGVADRVRGGPAHVGVDHDRHVVADLASDRADGTDVPPDVVRGLDLHEVEGAPGGEELLGVQAEIEHLRDGERVRLPGGPAGQQAARAHPEPAPQPVEHRGLQQAEQVVAADDAEGPREAVPVQQAEQLRGIPAGQRREDRVEVDPFERGAHPRGRLARDVRPRRALTDPVHPVGREPQDQAVRRTAPGGGVVERRPHGQFDVVQPGPPRLRRHGSAPGAGCTSTSSRPGRR